MKTLLTAALLASAMPALADPPIVVTAPVQPPAGSATAPDDRPVCRYVSTVGTRFRQRTCRTRSDWQRHDQELRDVARQGIENENVGNDPFIPGPRPQ